MWKPIDEYCWTNGDYNICKIGSANGDRYELWNARKKVQLAVNLPNSKAALVEWRRLVGTPTEFQHSAASAAGESA